MDNKRLESLARKWSYMTMLVLNLQELPIIDMQMLLRDTYKVLAQFHKDPLIPREITQIFLEMEEYLYFAALMEDIEVPTGYYCYRQVYIIVKALKEGFFNTVCVYTFPKLQFFDDFQNAHIINLESNFLPF